MGKAKKFLQKEKHNECGIDVVYLNEAYKAVEIAERSMKELAVDVYIKTCAQRLHGICTALKSRHPLSDTWGNDGCIGYSCLLVKEFIKKLDENEK